MIICCIVKENIFVVIVYKLNNFDIICDNGYVDSDVKIIFRPSLSCEIIVMSLGNIEALPIDTIISKFYPCEYMDRFRKFRERLPTKENIYSLLTGKTISDREYEHVINIWNTFEMKTMKYYNDLHLKCVALLLVDMFEKSRNMILKSL